MFSVLFLFIFAYVSCCCYLLFIDFLKVCIPYARFICFKIISVICFKIISVMNRFRALMMVIYRYTYLKICILSEKMVSNQEIRHKK